MKTNKTKKVSKLEKKKVPLGVKIIAWCYYICAIMELLIFIMFLSMIFFGSYYAASYIPLSILFYIPFIPLIIPIINNLSLVSLLCLILFIRSIFGNIPVALSAWALSAGLWAVLSFFIGKGLFRLKKWARKTSIIFSIIGFLMPILLPLIYFRSSDVQSGIFAIFLLLILIPSIIVYLAIALYFLFSKKVKEAFNYGK